MSNTSISDRPASSVKTQLDKFYFAAWRWHFYAALYVIPFIIMLSITGIVMVWFSAIAPEYGERMRITPEPNSLSLSEQAAIALNTHPDGNVTQYIAPYTSENPAIFRVALEGEARMIALNPYTGEVLRDLQHGDTWEDFANHLHGELLMTGAAKQWGDLAIEISASLALLLVATGLYLAWPRRGRRFRDMLIPDFSAKGRTFWKSLHTTLGTWMSLILIMFLITGLSWAGVWGGKLVQAWSTFPAEKWNNVPLSDSTHADMNHTPREVVPWALEQTPMPESGSEAGITGIPEGTAVGLESVAVLARTLGFGARFQLNFPEDETGVWTISRDSMSNDSTDPTSDRTVHVDQYTGKVLADIGFADYSLGGKAMAVGIPLHMGLMGLWNAILNIVACLVLVLASVASVVMWWKRRPQGAARIAAPPLPADVPFVKGALLIVLLLSLAFPVLGLTLLFVLTVDILILSPLPALKRALS